MKYHVIVVPVKAELEERTGGGGTFFAEEVDVDGAMGCFEDDSAGGGGFGAVNLAHLLFGMITDEERSEK